jgi:hypothetical protein
VGDGVTVWYNGERLSATMRGTASNLLYDLQSEVITCTDKSSRASSHSIAITLVPRIRIVEIRNDQVGGRNSSNRLNITLTPTLSSKSRNTTVTNSKKYS